MQPNPTETPQKEITDRQISTKRAKTKVETITLNFNPEKAKFDSLPKKKDNIFLDKIYRPIFNQFHRHKN